MGLVIPAVLIIVLLAVKEMMGASTSRRMVRAANFAYIPVLPLLVIFALQTAEEISRLPLMGS